MNRVSIFIDGFNLYHALDADPAYHKYKWLNLEKFSRCFTAPKDNIIDVFYFTAYITWNAQKLAKHQIYVKALQLAGVKPIFGAFRMKDSKCRICHKQYKIPEEKQTDVNIAINLFQTAIADTWDTALIISGDSDLIPAIEAVKKTFPTKQLGIAIPIGRRAEELKQVTDFHRKVKQKHLQTCQFDDAITIDDNNVLQRPATWS
ncbi:MAG: NYN domain-containing protein [Candidatus Auribacterota bacterium]|nr:NYN domain-containing protein [Candidatus Auribacterota bacterium]